MKIVYLRPVHIKREKRNFTVTVVVQWGKRNVPKKVQSRTCRVNVFLNKQNDFRLRLTLPS